jgi:diguanylate cyclase (GGDEF)-like protein/PAS domain S-box-containing protein
MCARIALPAKKVTERLSALSMDIIHHALQRRIDHLESQMDKLQDSFLSTKRSRDQYLDLYELAPIGYLTLDLQAKVLDINLSGAKLLGMNRDQIIGLPFANFIAGAESVRSSQLLEDVTNSGDPESFDVTLRRGDGTFFSAQLDCVRVSAKDWSSPVRITLVDITERKRAEAEIKQLAFYDPLTALPNRRLLLDRLQHTFIECGRTRQHGAIFFIDLNDFKSLNDSQGHITGDMLLQQVAFRISDAVREGDTVARLGGDEFVVMAQHLSGNPVVAARQAKLVGEKILAVFYTLYVLGGYEYRGTASIGMTLFKDDLSSVEDLLKRADMALYEAKTAGVSTMRFFDPEMQATATARDTLDIDLRLALKERQFLLYYQPQVNHEGRLTGVEALIRWQHPERGLLLPPEFIPFAEEKGLIGLIGEWVLEAACLQLVAWQSEPERAHLRIAMNVSALEFAHPDFVPRMLRVVDRIGIDASKLVLEFTERVMLGSMADTLAKMTLLKSRGIYFSLDDFGIGYSSLAYLQSLPLDELKIDRSFVRHILLNASDAAIACSIIALGNSLGLTVIAEGIETEAQRDFLAAQGCLAYQGYLFGKPVPVGELFAGSRNRKQQKAVSVQRIG